MTEKGTMKHYLSDEKHDYVPGEATHPMHTDPKCQVCGQAKHSPVHR